MKKKELEQKLLDIEQKLQTLGDLSALVQSILPQKQIADTLVAQLQAQKINIDAIPTKKQELEKLLGEVSVLKGNIEEQQNLATKAEKDVAEVKAKADEIQKLSLEQLGVISNDKLSNSFDKVKIDLKKDNIKWFWWLFGTSLALILAIAGIVIWQTLIGDTIFEISFLVKIALTSPIIFFEFFVGSQYSRTLRLIEEYEFKASIARSLEAYKEIIEDLFADQPGDDYKKKLNFILDSIGQLYSSPMRNIKENELNLQKIDRKIIPILTEIKNIISETKGIAPKI